MRKIKTVSNFVTCLRWDMKKVIEAQDVTFSYTVEGAGSQAVILMHGWGCDHTTLASIERLLTDSFTVYNVDFPGFGDSTEPPVVWGMEQYTTLIERLVQVEHIDHPIMMGHSFGGRVGIVYASRNDVAKLVLIDAAGIKPRRTLKYYIKIYSYKMYKRLLPLVVGKQRADKIIDNYRKRVGSSDYNNASPMMRSIMSRVVNEDLRHLMPSIKCPTLLVWGENDTATPVADARVMERLIPEAGLALFKGAGHYSFLDNPYQFAAVIRSFLSEEMKKK